MGLEEWIKYFVYIFAIIYLVNGIIIIHEQIIIIYK